MLAVLDCMVFAQALINPNGPAGECFERAGQAEFTIVVGPHVLTEVLGLPDKLPPR